nr:RNA-directed DNA polymerase, eukaryota, nucleotide-binding alpha-beta plait domain protein [Tanacetum cinerariifolium]
MGAHNKNSLQSKADQTVKISKSVFVSNFLEGCTAKDLWKVCNDYGTVVDVIIPNKKSKVGKRFAFVRFIKEKDPLLFKHKNDSDEPVFLAVLQKLEK